MSHFTVGVITEGKPTEEQIYKMLAPYQENNMGNCPQQYLKFVNIEKEHIKEYQNKFKKVYSSFENFMKEHHGYERDNKMGKYGYWENPNAKWDWYQIGGRWAGCLRILDKNSIDIIGVNTARIKDIIQQDSYVYQKRLRFWELKIEGQQPINDEEKNELKWCFNSPEYYRNKYKTKENFADLQSRLTTYAIITKDGKWHAAGQMGWFAYSSASLNEEEAFEKGFKEFVFEQAEDNDWLTVVDCHI